VGQCAQMITSEYCCGTNVCQILIKILAILINNAGEIVMINVGVL
jgi:hypothetical protein